MNPTEQKPPEYQPPDDASADVEHRFHHYTGNRIPWYVRLMWLLFWVFAVYYVLTYLFPALRIELTSPP
jgi:hypothetical protein